LPTETSLRDGIRQTVDYYMRKCAESPN